MDLNGNIRSNDGDEEINLISVENLNYYQYLPVEMVVHIMGYLPFEDIKSASLACKQWREAIYHPQIQKKFILHMSLSIEKSSSVYPAFIDSNSKFNEVHIETYHSQLDNSQIYSLINSKTNIFKHIKYLKINKTKLSIYALCRLLSKTQQLTHLSINACDIDNGAVCDLELCKTVMENLKVLIMTTSVIGNSDKLLTIFNLTSSLQEFDVYCTSFSTYIETSRQMVSLLISIIERNAKTLKKIYLKTFENGEPFLSICNINDLKLENLSAVFSHCSRPYVDGFHKFICQQKALKILDICTLSNLQMNLFPEHLINLEQLKIFACCDNITNFDINTISKFRNLKRLEVKGHLSLRQFTILPKINRSLTELIFEMSDVHEADIITISETFENLEIFKICSTSITDLAMQAIIKNLYKLKILKLDAYRGSDYGFSGINPIAAEYEGVRISHLKQLEKLRIFYMGKLNRDIVKKYFRFDKLKELCLENNGVHEKHILPADYLWHIINNCPSLTNMRFSFNEEATTSIVTKLTQMLKPRKKKISTCHFKNCITIHNIK